jgi:hypothetical protein
MSPLAREIHTKEGVNGVPLLSTIVTNIGQLSVSVKSRSNLSIIKMVIHLIIWARLSAPDTFRLISALSLALYHIVDLLYQRYGHFHMPSMEISKLGRVDNVIKYQALYDLIGGPNMAPRCH